MAPLDVEGAVLLREVLRPRRLAGHVERDELAGAVPRIDALAVGDGTGARQVVLVVHRRQLALGRDLMNPQPLARRSIEGFDDESDVGAGAARQRRLAGGRGIGALRQRRVPAVTAPAIADLRADEDAVCPTRSATTRRRPPAALPTRRSRWRSTSPAAATAPRRRTPPDHANAASRWRSATHGAARSTGTRHQPVGTLRTVRTVRT